MTHVIDLGDIGQSVPNFAPASTSIPAQVLRAQPRNSIVRQRVEAFVGQYDRNQAAQTGAKAISGGYVEDRNRKKDQTAKVKASGAPSSVIAEHDAEVQRAEQLLAAAWNEENRINGLLAEDREFLNKIARVLAEFHGKEIPLAKRPVLAAPKQSFELDYVKPQRAVIREVKAEIERPVVPELDDEIQSANRFVSTLARTAKISFDGGRIKWPEKETTAIQEMLRGPGPWPARFRGIDVEAALCRLFPDQLMEELEASIRDRYEVQHALAMSPDAARKRLRDLNARLREAEMIEVEATWRGLEAGENLRFRPDTNIRTLLGIAPG